MQMNLRALTVMSAISLLVLGPAEARGEDRCDASFVKAQKAEKAGQLVEARGAFDACASPTCGANMANLCNKRSLALEEQIPTVVVVAKEGDRLLPKVTVTIDGAKVAADGTAVAVNPGAHTFSFVAADGRTKSVDTIVVVGKKSQEIVAVFEPPAKTEPRPPVKTEPTKPTPDPGTPASRGSMRTTGLVIAGSGVVIAGVGGVLGLWAKSKYSASNESNCDPVTNRCNDAGLSQRSSAVKLGDVGTVVAIVGGVAAVSGVVLWLATPTTEAKPGVHAVGVGPTGFSIAGSF
jgi:hypothetical protein